MQTKLTIRVEKTLIQRAKRYAARSGKSLSGLVADLFSRLDVPGATPPLPPITRSLRGVLKGARLDIEDYRRHLEEKHQ